jgi:signal peptidase I
MSTQSSVTHESRAMCARWLQRTGLILVAGFVLMVGVRAAVAEVYTVPMASLEPELPQGSRVLVYKLDNQFQPGQIIAYQHSTGQVYLGRVLAIDATGVSINRNGVESELVAFDTIVGRVILNTR